ncbi:IS5/IS1182 family transposase [Salimicrobium salexigens]|uniref:Transposase n=1 Tax=Salimicrobium salexigens TaxID=908941 RepID=A0ABY1L0A1_9BACI|nr:IS5/IS1182 family transposase [Salimicrobium salexigens]SIT00154.1 transposase [Salimicrobium salexigens]
MSIIRQESLFDITDLYDMQPTHRYEAILSSLNLDPVMAVVVKKSRRGAPAELNYGAMVQSLIIRVVERIPDIKQLVRRLNEDPFFRFDCGFLLSDRVPSEASYTRIQEKIQEADVLRDVGQDIVHQAMKEGYIQDDTVAIDATHFEARDQAKKQEKKPKPEPKKRGRKSKAERDQWLKEKREREADLPLYEKTIEDQRTASASALMSQAPLEPAWGIKKNSEGKNVFWFGYKGHIAVGTQSQYILLSLMTSGNLNDGKAAIPLLKNLPEDRNLPLRYGTFDAGYDYRPIYHQLDDVGLYAVIAYNRRNEKEMIGFNEHFAPTCVREHSYRYDSYDETYDTLKYTAPKECNECPLQYEGVCQKVYKIKRTQNLRKYSAPARGSQKWNSIYKRRTAVERVIGYLKGYFMLNNVRQRTGPKAKMHFQLVTLVYNASKLAVDRLTSTMDQKITAS